MIPGSLILEGSQRARNSREKREGVSQYERGQGVRICMSVEKKRGNGNQLYPKAIFLHGKPGIGALQDQVSAMTEKGTLFKSHTRHRSGEN